MPGGALLDAVENPPLEREHFRPDVDTALTGGARSALGPCRPRAGHALPHALGVTPAHTSRGSSRSPGLGVTRLDLGRVIADVLDASGEQFADRVEVDIRLLERRLCAEGVGIGSTLRAYDRDHAGIEHAGPVDHAILLEAAEEALGDAEARLGEFADAPDERAALDHLTHLTALISGELKEAKSRHRHQRRLEGGAGRVLAPC